MKIPARTRPARRSKRAADADTETVYAIASTRRERIEAFRLVYDNYVKKGLIPENPDRMRVTSFHLLPTTQVFVAKRHGRVVCTVTLIGDGQLGVPMDETNPDVVERRRRKDLFIGEVSCLACRQLEARYFFPVFLKLTRLMAQHARAFGMDQFLIATIPQHARFYKRVMGFQQVAQEQPYHTVSGTLGVACCLDFSRIDRDRPACYEMYFGSQIPRSELLPRPMTPVDVDFFSRAVTWAESDVPAMV